ncbi:MAG: AraC family transcriptional regulator [Anaerolineae bacterium]|nr:AraC family transcriptional regulator [Anaerolineae bacterium]
MDKQDSTKIWSVPHLDGLSLLRANFVTYSFARHMHDDYFVIGMVEAGMQKFAYRRDQYITPPTGIIVINPGEPHTGEAAIETGFRYRALYPSLNLMQHITSEIKGRPHDLPFFPQPVIHDRALFSAIYQMHTALETATSTLEHESRFLWAVAQLITRHADAGLNLQPIGRERIEIQRVRHLLEERYADDIKLDELAQVVHWNPFYLLRVFRNEIGLPPHAYLENVRVRQAQYRLREGMALAQVAYETGFSSQSHFNRSFKRFIGVTPGQYAKQVNILKDASDDNPLS